jgi:hypothetical protein
MAVTGTHLATWVTSETKQRFGALARMQELSESALLKRLVVLTLQSTSVAGLDARPTRRTARDARLCVRLRPDDQRLLSERAAARSMAPATYVSVLVRAHLHELAPLPKDELLALKRSVAELGAIGRNLNQIAKVANSGARTAPGRDDLRAMLKVCEGLRDHVKLLIKANISSWETGDAKAGD